MIRSEKFAKWVFTAAGIWGLVVLTPLYLARNRIGRVHPPAITHAEFFYGFIGVALSFQIVFLIIARDPVRFRPLMIAAILEKLAFVVPAAILLGRGELAGDMLIGAFADLVLGILFAVSLATTPSRA